MNWHKILKWLPAAFWMGFIFYLSHQTGSQLHGLFPFIQDFNVGHFIAYFVLALTFYYALKNKKRILKLPVYITCVLFSTLYGLTDEWHQYYVPSRHADWLDLLNDAIGASLAMLTLVVRKKFRVNKTSSKDIGSSHSH